MAHRGVTTPRPAEDMRLSGLSVAHGSSWCHGSSSSLEAVLRRRIHDLEQLEQHLRRQVEHTHTLAAKHSAFTYLFSLL